MPASLAWLMRLASVTCLSSASLPNTPVTFMLNAGGGSSFWCLILMCLTSAESAVEFLRAAACCLPLWYALSAVSPTYTSPHCTHWISYVTPSFLHLAFPDHTGHSLCSLDLVGGGGLHSLSLKGLERCNIDFSDLPVVSTTFTLIPASWISF